MEQDCQEPGALAVTLDKQHLNAPPKAARSLSTGRPTTQRRNVNGPKSGALGLASQVLFAVLRPSIGYEHSVCLPGTE